ncbi:MAG TPA: DNA polymerase III subunit alpha [Xanthomonadales bacterium]|nr:DNA polymerase III subunit alpha [Xanthomonadales bacterium]
MSIPFVHLHLHTEFSLVDGTVRIPALVKKAARSGMPAIAVTDHMNLFSLVKFYRAAEKAGIKPIVGADLIVVDPQLQRSRLTVLCQNRQGYLSLCRLLSRAFLEGQINGRPHVHREWLDEAADGLIALAGPGSDIGQALYNNHPNKAESLLKGWCRVFGDRFYVELQRTGREHESRIERHLISLASRNECPLVASNDVRFLKQEDYRAHEARVCIHEGRLLSDKKRVQKYSEQQYLRNPEEMAELFADLPEALANSVEIAKRCTLSLEFGQYFLPDFPTPDGQDIETFLAVKAEKGLRDRLKRHHEGEHHLSEGYSDRLKRELGVINSMGFAGYFLIVADFIRWAKKNQIPVGPGRGSGAGSVVAYALGITDLDPLEFDLLFERFLNPERVSMPDFDIDFCMEGRDRVIEYVADTYGHDQVSQIITFGTMAAKAVVRDCGRVLGHGYGHVDSIAKMIPFTLGITLKDALAEEPALKKRYKEEEDTRAIIDLAMSLEGLTRNAGKHAGGVVIAPSPLTDFMPLFCESGGGSIVSQLDKDDVETMGLVKFDFLGLRTLTIIDRALETINALRKKEGEPPVNLEELPMDDTKTFSLLQSTRTTAVFQLESRGMKDLMRRLVPDSFDEIVALVALFRPGPLESGMVGDYIDRKHGRATVVYPHPKLEPILEPTYGVILYQEQVMQIAQELAGYSLGSADILRRAMGKKKPSEMAKQRLVFVEGATERGVDESQANMIFDQMETFAGYGFNKSHSAAYALIAYQTAWLKAHYTPAFMAAVFSTDMDNTDKMDELIHECTDLGIKLLPPNINRSNYVFAADLENNIRYGLGAIKGVGRNAIEIITTERDDNGPFSSLQNFCSRIDLRKVNRRAVDVLIRCGALDKLDPDHNRARLMAQLPSSLQAAEQAQQNAESGQSDMFGSPVEESTTIQISEVDSPVQPWSRLQLLQAEREALGLYLTGHPVKLQAKDLSAFTTCAIHRIPKVMAGEPGGNGNGRGRGTPMVVAGMVQAIRRRNRGGGFATIEDGSGRLEISMFDEGWNLYADLLVKDEIVVVEGNVSHDDFSGGYRMRVQKVMSLVEAKNRFASGISIALRSPDPTVCDELNAAFAPYRGGRHRVYVDYSNGRARAQLEFGQDHQIRACDELIAALRGLDQVKEARLLF